MYEHGDWFVSAGIEPIDLNALGDDLAAEPTLPMACDGIGADDERAIEKPSSSIAASQAEISSDQPQVTAAGGPAAAEQSQPILPQSLLTKLYRPEELEALYAKVAASIRKRIFGSRTDDIISGAWVRIATASHKASYENCDQDEFERIVWGVVRHAMQDAWREQRKDRATVAGVGMDTDDELTAILSMRHYALPSAAEAFEATSDQATNWLGTFYAKVDARAGPNEQGERSKFAQVLLILLADPAATPKDIKEQAQLASEGAARVAKFRALNLMRKLALSAMDADERALLQSEQRGARRKRQA